MLYYRLGGSVLKKLGFNGSSKSSSSKINFIYGALQNYKFLKLEKMSGYYFICVNSKWPLMNMMWWLILLFCATF